MAMPGRGRHRRGRAAAPRAEGAAERPAAMPGAGRAGRPDRSAGEGPRAEPDAPAPDLRWGLSAEQRAEIEPWLQEGETLAAFLAAAIRAELAWRRMTRPEFDGATPR